MNNERELIELYLKVLKNSLTDFHRATQGEYKPIFSNINFDDVTMPSPVKKYLNGFNNFLAEEKYEICKYVKYHPALREQGRDWPNQAETMIGLKRLENIEYCVKNIISDNIEGDLIETGVWRGGAVIFMKAILKAFNVNDKQVWVADSFEGLPPKNQQKYPADATDIHHMSQLLKISLEDVKDNFRKYDLLDDKVKFLKGWFKDTLKTAPIGKLSLIRLDGDMYESTMDGFHALYHKLQPGGYLIVDDYGAIEACKKAVHDFRESKSITEEIHKIDWTGVYWRKK